MISGISSVFGGALGGLSAAAARFDRAASGVSDAAEAGSDDAAAGDVGLMSDALVQMAAARFAFLASLHVAVATNDMVGQMLSLGDGGARPAA